MVNKMNKNTPFTKSDVMMFVYEMSNKDQDLNQDVFGKFRKTIKNGKKVITFVGWEESNWVCVVGSNSELLYLIYRDKLFRYNISRGAALLAINKDKNVVYSSYYIVDRNGLVRDCNGKFFSKLKLVKW